jgi:hypothetical protein
MIVGPIAFAIGANVSGSRLLVIATSIFLRANTLASAWPTLPKPIIA